MKSNGATPPTPQSTIQAAPTAAEIPMQLRALADLHESGQYPCIAILMVLISPAPAGENGYMFECNQVGEPMTPEQAAHLFGRSAQQIYAEIEKHKPLIVMPGSH